MNSKYAKFGEYLANNPEDHVRVSFKDIEKILGLKLPKTAYKHDTWWANTVYQPFMKTILKSGWRQHKIEMFIEFVEFKKVFIPQVIKHE